MMSHTIIRGDARRLPLPDACVDLIVTSPPFLNLRSYQDAGQHYDGQIGTGTQPEFLEQLWDATAEMKRVIKPTGSIFVELGDSYTNKCLNHSPHRYVIGCIDRLSLICRAEIIWDRPNGLPESVTDRVRRSHSVWFHFTLLPRYFSAIDTIREPQLHGLDRVGTANRQGVKWQTRSDGGDPRFHAQERILDPLGKLPGSVWSIPSQPLTVPPELGVDHFAAFPMEWPRRLILGWSPSGICTVCGEGRRPVALTMNALTQDTNNTAKWSTSEIAERNGRHRRPLRTASETTITGEVCACTPYTDHPGTGESSGPQYSNSRSAIGKGEGAYPATGYSTELHARPKVGPRREYHDWTPPPTRPAVVLDPFGGTGTTALVADMLGRHGISVDMSADYSRLARWRCNDPGQRAAALQVDKPEPVMNGQMGLFEGAL